MRNEHSRFRVSRIPLRLPVRPMPPRSGRRKGPLLSARVPGASGTGRGAGGGNRQNWPAFYAPPRPRPQLLRPSPFRAQLRPRPQPRPQRLPSPSCSSSLGGHSLPASLWFQNWVLEDRPTEGTDGVNFCLTYNPQSLA